MLWSQCALGFNPCWHLLTVFSSVAQQHTRLPCPSPTPGVYPNSCPLNRWCHQPSRSLSSPSPPTFNLSQHQGPFKWVSFLHQVAKVLEFQLQHQSFQWIFRVDFLYDWLVWSSCSPRNSQVSSSTPQFKSINSSVLRFLYGPNLTSIHYYWKNYSFDQMDIFWQSNISDF